MVHIVFKGDTLLQFLALTTFKKIMSHGCTLFQLNNGTVIGISKFLTMNKAPLVANTILSIDGYENTYCDIKGLYNPLFFAPALKYLLASCVITKFSLLKFVIYLCSTCWKTTGKCYSEGDE